MQQNKQSLVSRLGNTSVVEIQFGESELKKEKGWLLSTEHSGWMGKWFMKKREKVRAKYGSPWVKVAVLSVWSPLFQQDQRNAGEEEFEGRMNGGFSYDGFKVLGSMR